MSANQEALNKAFKEQFERVTAMFKEVAKELADHDSRLQKLEKSGVVQKDIDDLAKRVAVLEKEIKSHK